MGRFGWFPLACAAVCMPIVGIQAQQNGDSHDPHGSQVASDIIGTRVENPQGNNLGSVTDLMIDPRTGRVACLILARGRVLAAGMKLYPVPWQAVNYNRTNDRFVLDISEQRLNGAPQFPRDNWPDLASSAWQERVSSFYEGQGRGTGGSRGMVPPVEAFDPETMQTVSGTIIDISAGRAPSDFRQITLRTSDGRTLQVDLAPASYLDARDFHFDEGDKVTVRGSLLSQAGQKRLIATQMKTEGGQIRLRSSQGQPLWQEATQPPDEGMGGTFGQAGEAEGMGLRQLLRASQLTDKSLQNTQGQRIAPVNDLVIDLADGKVEYVVAGTGGGFLGMGQNLHAIPWSAMDYNVNRQALVLDATRQKLENAPGFKRDNWPDFQDPAWRSRIDGYYGTQGTQANPRPMRGGLPQDSGSMQRD